MIAMHDTIIEAIQQRRVLELNCHPGWRIVEPHAYGRDANNEPALRAYQVSGASNGESAEGWRLFPLSKILQLRFCGGQSFVCPRDDYARYDGALSGGVVEQI